ncbi:MAG: hypothetical protein ACLP9Y_14425 [Mycobacterium sp.]
MQKGGALVEPATEVRWQEKRFVVTYGAESAFAKVGYDAVFTAEGYGAEELVPLGYIVAHTTRLKLVTRIAPRGRAEPLRWPRWRFRPSTTTLNHLMGGG